MNAQTHFEKAERLASAQTKLDPATDWESIVEGCYMAAYNYVPAGAEWLGVQHKQNHMHKQNVSLLRQANAPQAVREAWDQLETKRAGNVYGAKTNGVTSAEARRLLQTIHDWVAGLRP